MIGIETAGLVLLGGMYAGLVVSQISGGQRRVGGDPTQHMSEPARSAVVGGDYLDPTETERRMQVEQARWRLLC